MKDFNDLIIAIAIFILAIAAATYIGRLMYIPQCQEDVVLVGIGQFENGRWDNYICGPAVDDYGVR